MDTITHTVLGAVLGEAVAGKKMGKRAMLWGALANNAPDIDVLPGMLQSIPDSLLSHRGFTHSILFALIVPPVLAWLFQKRYQKQNYGFKAWYLIFASGFFVHILLDSLTNYGTGWFEPFNHYRVAFNTIFVLDPFYTIALLISCIALLILKYNAAGRKQFIAGGLLISSCYLVFTFFNKAEINNEFEKTLAANRITGYQYMTTPTPLNNILWYNLAKNKDGFYIGYRSLLDKDSASIVTFVPRNDSLLGHLKDDPGVKKLIRFSQDYYCITKSDTGGIYFHDMRFGQIGGWDNDPNARFVFTYHIDSGLNNRAAINQGRFEASTGDAFRSLIERIKGND